MELSERDKQAGMKAGIFLVDGQNTVIPTNYGKASALINEMHNELETAFKNGVVPDKTKMRTYNTKMKMAMSYMSQAIKEGNYAPQLWAMADSAGE